MDKYAFLSPVPIEGCPGHCRTAGGCILGIRPEGITDPEWVELCRIASRLLGIHISVHMGRHAAIYLVQQSQIVHDTCHVWITVQANPDGSPSPIGQSYFAIRSLQSGQTRVLHLDGLTAPLHTMWYAHVSPAQAEDLDRAAREVVWAWFLSAAQVVEEAAKRERQGLDETPAVRGGQPTQPPEATP